MYILGLFLILGPNINFLLPRIYACFTFTQWVTFRFFILRKKSLFQSFNLFVFHKNTNECENSDIFKLK